ncbi:uncharacterized protein LOC130047282 [Ostrea edulis]|uniref:uncharacterized protein LOC130047282 n=1 Tax=Ostrea edulis TaxID=37623 RepID=UPI0024AF04AD|nr:uncharacterized protein LOC130047282 [Ostrea edulis]
MASPDPEVMANKLVDYEDADNSIVDHEDDIDIEFNRRGSGDWRPHGTRGLNLKPEPFNGSDDWQEYISHFEVCAELGRWNDHEKVLVLAVCLRGPARTFYISLPAEFRQPYNILITKLEQRFGSSRQQNRWLSKFESRRRKPTESIATLADDIRQMSQKAYPNLDALAQEPLSINQLYKSISLEMKCRCIDKDCQTIADAVEVIERYEADLEDGEKRKQPVRALGSDDKAPRKTQGSPSVSQTEISETLKAILSRLEKLESGQSSRFNGRQNPHTRACFICQAPDHFMRECPRNQQNQNTGKSRCSNMPGSYNQGNFRPSTQ